MSKTIDDIDLSGSELIPENLLYEIFEVQYDDLFCKILKITEKSFTYFLQQQVIFNLLIIQKKVDPSILTAFQELFTKRYKENIKTMKKNFEIIKDKEKNNSDELTYLDATKCYIHCHKCYNIVHKCGCKLILYDEHIYCTKCNNVYNKNQIMLFCVECKKNYFTKLRKPIYNNNKKFEKLFMLKYKKYHCPSGKEEKIKCVKCSNNLYFRLMQNNPKIEDSIKTIYCIKCKLKYNLKEVYFKCKICLSNFKCEARIYRDFPAKKKKLLFLIHTLLRNKNALPNFDLYTKKCNCNLKSFTEYTHDEDGGKYLEGIKNNKKLVVCNICFKIFDNPHIKWKCPSCGENFRYKNSSKSKNMSKNKNKNMKNNNNQELIEKSKNNDLKGIPTFKRDLKNINNRNNIYNIYKKVFDVNDYVLNSEQNTNKINKVKITKITRITRENYDITTNFEKLKKIFINKNDINKNNNRSFLIVKSKSKNDMMNSRRRRNKKALLNKEPSKEKINLNVLKDINNSEEKKEEKQIIHLSNKKSLDSNSNNKKTIDTKAIFNNIKNNIFNLDESDQDLCPKNAINGINGINGKKRPMRASGHNVNKYLNNNEEIEPQIEQEPNIVKSIIPKYKNSSILHKKEIYNKEMYNHNNFNNHNNGYEEKEIFPNEDIFDSNHKLQSIDNYENIPIEKKNKKKHINIAKKIFFFNGKSDKDSNSYDEKININNNKFLTNELYKKYMKYSGKDNSNNNIEMQNNNYINSSEYVYGNEDNYYDNFYYNFQNYDDYSQVQQPINLYNFNSENYSIIKIIGKGSNGKIYMVEDLQTQQTFALKSMLIDNEAELKQREEQYNLIYKIAYENPELKIINIYGLELRKIDRYNMFLNILMEKADCDWETEILNRKKNKRFYTEQELYFILMNLVGTFAFLQEKGISHRDVKPQNILCFRKNIYKICDFGEAKCQNDKTIKKFGNNLDISNQTIRGTEMYMSPILFRAVKFKPDSLTKYNSFKSDVFSLGLCFLHASSLDSEILIKVREIVDMEKIRIIVNQYLGNKYSQEFIDLLLYMLQVDENYRPDFIELNSWLQFGNY